MKDQRKLALAGLMLSVLLAGCGGGGGGGGEASAPAPAAPAPAPAVAGALKLAVGTTEMYASVPSASKPLLQVHAFVPGTATWQPIRGYTTASLGVSTVAGVAVDPLGRFVYLGDPSGPTGLQVKVHAIAADGQVNTAGRLATPYALAALSFTPDGKYVYGWERDGSNNGRLRGFSLAADGTFTELGGSPFLTTPVGHAFNVRMDPSGRFLFLAYVRFSGTPGGETLARFSVDAATGALRASVIEEPSVASATAGNMVFAGTRRVWVQRPDGWALYAFDVQTGAFTPQATAATFPLARLLAASASGQWLVVASPEGNGQFAQMQLYAFTEAGNALTAVGAPVRAPAQGFRADPVGDTFRAGDLVLRADASRGLQVVAAGSITGVPVFATAPADPVAYTYALDADAGLVRLLKVDDATGALTQVSGGAAAMPGRPVGLAVSPRRDYVVVVSSNGAAPGAIKFFRISHPAMLMAGQTTAIPVGAQPTAVTTSADGRHVYVSHAQGIDAFRYETTGAVERVAGSPFATGFAPIGTTLDPQRNVFVPQSEAPEPVHPAVDLLHAGGVLFAATNVGAQGELSTMGTNPDGTLHGIHTGVPACANGMPAMGSTFTQAGSGTVGLGTVATGRFVYALNRDSNTLNAWRTAAVGCGAEGWIPAVAGSPFATGVRPTAFAVDPAGRHVFVANSGGSGTVSAFVIHPVTGTLTPAPGSPFPLAMVPARVWTDHAGRYLYTSDAAGNVDVLTIDRGTGALGAPRSTLTGLRAHVGTDVVLGVR